MNETKDNLTKKLSVFLAISKEEHLRLVGVLGSLIKQHGLPILVDRLSFEINGA